VVKVNFENPAFIKSAVAPNGYPPAVDQSGKELPEVAVAGRSNVGKSTLLNHLFRRKNLVKTSATPGKTQTLNFFNVDEKLFIADLPGYGYAKVPPNVKKRWGPMMQRYFAERSALKLVLLLMDIRRTPTEEDLQFLEWAVHEEVAVILVLTKVDKVKLNERNRNTKKIVEAINLENLHYVHYSAEKNIGRRQLIGMLNEALYG